MTTAQSYTGSRERRQHDLRGRRRADSVERLRAQNRLLRRRVVLLRQAKALLLAELERRGVSA